MESLLLWIKGAFLWLWTLLLWLWELLISFFYSWILDVTIAVFLLVLNAIAWKGFTKTPETNVEERSLGANAILTQLSGIITANSIVLAGIGAVIALGKPDLPDIVRKHLFLAATWNLVSLGCAVWTLGTVPPQVVKYNLAKSKVTALLTVASLYLFVIAVARFFFALWGLL